MAKVTKKNSSTKQNKNINKKKKSLDLVKLFEQFKIKDCRVMLANVVRRDINIKVNKNTLQFNGNTMKPSENKSNDVTYNLTFNVKLNKLITDQCDVIEPSSKHSASKTLAAESDRAWRAAKKSQKNSNETLNIDQIVVTKMKSYCPWPAQVRAFSKNAKRAEVYFFGTHNIGMVDVHEIVDFSQAYDVMRFLLLRKIPYYAKAVRELEEVLQVPAELSMLKEMQAISN